MKARGLEQSILWLTHTDLSHETAIVGRHGEGDDRIERFKGRPAAEICTEHNSVNPCMIKGVTCFCRMPPEPFTSIGTPDNRPGLSKRMRG
jgi:hypothetical protein